MSRIAEMLSVLDHYPEFAASGVPFKKIVEACCRRIPTTGIADGNLAADVLTVACEVTVDAMEREGLRGPSVANYIVASFKRMASEGVTHIDRLSRVGVRNELAEMRRLDAETARRRAEDAARPLPNPELPKRALAAFPGRPDPDAWPTAGGKTRPTLPERRKPAPEDDKPARIGKLVDGDTIREARELADAEAQWRRT